MKEGGLPGEKSYCFPALATALESGVQMGRRSHISRAKWLVDVTTYATVCAGQP